MGGEQDDDGLGLSLSLRCPENHNLTADVNGEQRSLFGGIDMNRAMDGEDDQEVNVSSPNSTVSSQLSGKRSEREENDGDSLEIDDDSGGDGSGRKKLRLSKEQAAVLEETFKEHNTLNPGTKLKQTEVDCGYLRRCCENLTEENRRLQKEVTELRALKLSPQLYMNMSPPTTLTMCQQCERVAVSSAPGRQPPHHHHRPMPISSWAAVIPPQRVDTHRSRT
ncbi:hypothetical protein CASFOL_007525 [Castilleja foliolosa]|uniref:Leucine zipper homeobox-associated domain-containing protein n=1 Tax=Castilleja foliolosa TaxID=1961234 RepID=A0ABD3EA79_9LAMI